MKYTLSIVSLWRQQIVRFTIVGAINTLTDLVILNLLVFAWGIKPLVANVISTSIGVFLSYFWNRRLVFMVAGQFSFTSLCKFAATTALGLLLIQTLIIYGLERLITIEVVSRLLSINMDQAKFVQVNSAKIGAVLGSLLWNYTFYRKVIFKKTD